MANHYTTNKDEWRALADIDYYIENNGNRIINGQKYRVQYGDKSSDTKVHSVIKKKNGDNLFTLQQESYNVSELTACPGFNGLSIKQKNCLLACYKAVMPDSIMNLLDGLDPNDKTQYYLMGQIKFVRDNENIAKGLIEVLYKLRNSLFHGELIPNKEANKIYGVAYKILRELIEAL